MKNIRIWTAEVPCLHVLDRDSFPVDLDAIPPSGINFVAHFDGSAMTSQEGIFEQFSREFRFPDYFGWNWAALSDCLRDLEWLPADRYLVIIEEAEWMLTVSEDLHKPLLRILARVAKEWADPLGKRLGLGVPFNVLFLCTAGKIESLQNTIQSDLFEP